MDINFWAIGFSTIGLLLLAPFIFSSIRWKSIWGGLRAVAVISAMLLLIAVPIIGLLSLMFLFPLLPEEIQLNIGFLSTFIGGFLAAVFTYASYRRRKLAGDFIDKERRKIAQLIQGAITFLIMYCSFTVQGALLPRDYFFESFRRNVFWWIVIICLALYSYYSFEYREKGFVHRGRIILFSNVEHAEWVDRWKVKLKVRLKKHEAEMTLRIPYEMSVSMENYVKANFPRP